MATITATSGSYSIIGAPATRALVLGVAAGVFALTGTSATFVYGKGLAATSGTYTLTGTGINTRRIAAEPGSYAIGGQSATLSTVVEKIIATTGTYGITSGTTILEHAVPSQRGSYITTGIDATLVRSGDPVLGATSGTYALTGTFTGLVYTSFLGVGDYNLTGTATTLRKGKGLVGLSGIYSVVAGPVVQLKWRHIFPSGVGIYTLSGKAITLVFSGSSALFLITEPGTYTLNGTTVSLRIGRRLTALPGTYALTGSTAILTKGVFTLDAGVYSLTGTIASLRKTWKLSALGGTYTLNGTPTILTIPFFLPLASGHYALTGSTVVEKRSITLSVASGVYQSSGGVPPVFLRATHLVVDSGTYALSGTAANLISTHRGRWHKPPKPPRSFSSTINSTTNWDEQPPSPGV